MENEKQPPKSRLADHFLTKEREPEIAKLWEQSHFQSLDTAAQTSGEVFNIAMPPPNANGELHLGHALGYSIMDILGRYHRLQGKRVMLLPGKDHAGIQTQVVFEKKLQNEKRDTKSIPTTKLYDECYAFCIDRAQYMRAQEKRLGLSADWERELFTLDPRLNEIVFETFCRMWKEGLVYKGSRIVNWSVFSQTSISDVEVEYKEQDGGLWTIAYPLEQGGQIKTATTRPETMLGDTGLAVHPDDERYKNLIGKFAIVPLVNRKIPIVADKRVDLTFGTGVVKVTPAHDFADYDMGVDHKLEIIQVIGKDGRMTQAAGAEFVGKKTAEARELVVTKLTEQGLLVDKAIIKHKVPIGERGKDVIEPLISEQWFINVDKPGNSLKGRALELLRSGQISIYPARFKVLFEQWLENLRDWNISRQLWWGHRLPVWYRKGSDKKDIIVSVTAPTEGEWEQETDIFDTWFSSGQWAYSTMAAHGLVDLNAKTVGSDFFPTHTMVMGRDILFFWACRMLLLSAYRVNTVPWKNIFFTGLIRDEHGQKMSKSKGNGIDPNEMVDKYGADALRLGLVMGASPGNDISLSEKKIDGYSKFINKIWNASKLIDMKFGSSPVPKRPDSLKLESSKWIISKLHATHKAVTEKLNAYEVSIAADELYNFTWSEFCDWYLEMIKILAEKGDEAMRAEAHYVAVSTLRATLTMLHPLLPFVTEEIYQQLPWLKTGEVLATERWNQHEFDFSGAVPEIELTKELATAIRSVKAALMIPHKRIQFACSAKLSPEVTLLTQELARADLTTESEIPSEMALRKPFSGGSIVCEVPEKEKYRERLQKDLAAHQGVVSNLQTKLAGAFAIHGKPEVVAKERERLEQSQRAIVEIGRELEMVS